MKRILFALLVVVLLAGASARREAPHDKRFVEGGTFIPLYGTAKPDEALPVRSFYLDTYPVTNERFYAFVTAHPEWSPGRVNPLLADSGYLRDWRDHTPIAPASDDMQRPVVRISWFAASAFCKANGGRLPSVLEWEYAAAASESKRDASRDPEFVQRLLAWYAAPTGDQKPGLIGQRSPNVWGIHDLHGLVWEWTEDFNSVFVAGDSRRDGEQLKNMFCGGGAVSSADKANYAAFMRYALRNSLQGSYTTESLGFRCAYDR